MASQAFCLLGEREGRMGVFDQTARRLIHLKPLPLLRWLVPDFLERFAYERWADTRTTPFPGEPDRTADLVASFRSTDNAEDRRLLNIEVQAEPHPDMLERLALYAWQLRLDHREGQGQAGKPRAHSLLLNLTGAEQPTQYDMGEPTLGGGHVSGAGVCTLREMGALAIVQRVESGELDFSVLPWVPLMQGADQSGIIEGWIAQADREPHPPWRAELGAFALIFSDLADRGDLWREGLKEWNMQTSETVRQWIEQGKKQGLEQGREQGLEQGREQGREEGAVVNQRRNLLRILEVMHKESVPQDLRERIEQESSLSTLEQWFDLALGAESLESFRQAIGQTGNAGSGNGQS